MPHRTKPIVAIDGPAGAGKSTVSRRVADALGYLLLDTGALYRCVGLAAHRAGGSDDPDAVGQIAEQLAARGAISFIGRDAQGVSRVAIDGAEVSDAIRTAEAGQWASKASAIPAVRAALLEMQRAAGRRGAVVVEGRDIGTVVFPDAEAKFFLTASVEERARRRFEQLGGDAGPKTLSEIEADVRERDVRDSSRSVAPLRQADDAVFVDSTGITLDEVVDRIVRRTRQVETALAEQSS